MKTEEASRALHLIHDEPSLVKTLIAPENISELAFNSRCGFHLALLVADVTNDNPTENTAYKSAPKRARAARGLSVHVLPRSSKFLPSGRCLQLPCQPGLESDQSPTEVIQEMSLEASSFQPEVAQNGGALMVTMKLGSKGFHTEAFNPQRNSASDIWNFIDYISSRPMLKFV